MKLSSVISFACCVTKDLSEQMSKFDVRIVGKSLQHASLLVGSLVEKKKKKKRIVLVFERTVEEMCARL